MLDNFINSPFPTKLAGRTVFPQIVLHPILVDDIIPPPPILATKLAPASPWT